MKKNLILLTGICTLLLTASCSNFLSEDNKSNIVADSYYKTKAGYENLINSTYAQLRTLYGQSDDVWMYCGGTDIFWRGRSDNNDEQAISTYQSLTPSNGIVTQYYQDSYHAIQVANTAIYYNSRTESAPTLKSRLGEATFLRALFYFNLVRFFGGVALVTNRINTPILNFQRTPADSVYSFIINQMQQALNDVPETNDPGRVDKRTVLFYLAKAYLARGYQSFGSKSDFTEAAKYADEAINGQALTMSFAQQWFPGNENNPDVIFSVQYSKSSMIDPSADGNDQNYFFSPYLGGEGQTQGYPYRSHTLFPDPFLFSLFSQYDTRLEATFMLNYYNRYYDFFDQNGSLNNLTVKYYYVPTWAENDTTAWKAADPAHRDSTIIIPEEDWAPDLAYDPYRGAPLPPPVKKFDDPTSVFGSNSSSRNIILARLAEAYLVSAEAYYKSGDAATAAQRINVVRERAAEPGHETDMMITPAQVTIDLILNERARELLGEYHRWFDLTRTGTLISRDEKYNRNIQAWFNQGINPFKGANGQLKLLRPIPQSAIDLNHTTIKQNPGY